jgi:hypothetical protein
MRRTVCPTPAKTAAIRVVQKLDNSYSLHTDRLGGLDVAERGLPLILRQLRDGPDVANTK